MIIIKYFCLFNVSWLLLATYPFYTDATPQKNARSRSTLYQIKPNDTLWHIAAQYLPTALDWPTLYHANAYIVDPNLIYPQKPLVIPAADKFEARASTGFIDLAYGVGFNARPRTNTPPNTPGWGSDSYRADSVANTPITSLTVGYQWFTTQRWFPSFSLGLRYSYLWSTAVQGRISLMGGRFANYYQYAYTLQAQTLMLQGTVGLYSWQHFKPYLIVGLGAAMNTFSGYHEHEIVPDHGFRPEIPPGYGNKTRYQLAYSLGLGVAYQLTEHWQIKVDYQWQNLGEVSSTQGKATYKNDQLSQQYVLQTVMLHLTYLF